MKKAVCSGYYGFDNFGDDAVLKVLVDNFSSKYDLTVFSSNPDKTSRLYDVSSIYSFDYLKVITALLKCDVLISGGGSLLQDVTSVKSLLYYCGLIFLAGIFRKEIIIFAQGMGPFNSLFSKFFVKFVLKFAKIITVRDDASFELLKKWGLSPVLVCDPVFNIQIPMVYKNSAVGIQLRDFVGVDDNFLKSIANVINENFSDKEVVIFSFQDSKDLKICEHFNTFLNANATIKHNLSIDEYITEISQLEYLFAMRFHAVLVALKAGVKVLPISYDKKVSELAKEVEVPYVTLDDYEHLSDLVFELKNQNVNKNKELLNLKHLDFNIFDI